MRTVSLKCGVATGDAQPKCLEKTSWSSSYQFNTRADEALDSAVLTTKSARMCCSSSASDKVELSHRTAALPDIHEWGNLSCPVSPNPRRRRTTGDSAYSSEYSSSSSLSLFSSISGTSPSSEVSTFNCRYFESGSDYSNGSSSSFASMDPPLRMTAGPPFESETF